VKPSSSRPDGDLAIPDELVDRFRMVDCRRCGGVLKPDVVYFGEPVPRERFRRALALLDASSMLLVLGSSLTVGSGFRFVTGARRAALPIAIVNRGVTRGDPYADLKIDAPLAAVLPPLAEALAGTSGRPRTDPARTDPALTD
jgi:NAD-dependent SIR2 family protein deacetylase